MPPWSLGQSDSTPPAERRCACSAPPRRVRRGQHEGDVRLDEPLRHRDHVELFLAELAEELGRDARRAAHPLADHGDDDHLRLQRHTVDQPAVDLPGERDSSAATTCAASGSGTTKQMLCSDEACEIIRTLAPCAATAAKVRGGDAGHTHHAPAGHGDQRQPADDGERLDGADVDSLGHDARAAKAGLKVLRTLIGMPRSMAGSIVLGCSTLAPK